MHFPTFGNSGGGGFPPKVATSRSVVWVPPLWLLTLSSLPFSLRDYPDIELTGEPRQDHSAEPVSMLRCLSLMDR